MHELSIATAILEQVETASARNGGVHVTKVGVRIGELPGIDIDAMQRCASCSREFPAPNSETVCPDCGSQNTSCISGEELDIAFMETEDE